jgi:hypothetical protein
MPEVGCNVGNTDSPSVLLYFNQFWREIRWVLIFEDLALGDGCIYTQERIRSVKKSETAVVGNLVWIFRQ